LNSWRKKRPKGASSTTWQAAISLGRDGAADGGDELLRLRDQHVELLRANHLAANVVASGVESRLASFAQRIEAHETSAAELAVADQVMRLLRARFGADLLYARVDLLPAPAGPLLIELELTEPSLFLSYDAKAADRLAEAIAVRA